MKSIFIPESGDIDFFINTLKNMDKTIHNMEVLGSYDWVEVTNALDESDVEMIDDIRLKLSKLVEKIKKDYEYK